MRRISLKQEHLAQKCHRVPPFPPAIPEAGSEFQNTVGRISTAGPERPEINDPEHVAGVCILTRIIAVASGFRNLNTPSPGWLLPFSVRNSASSPLQRAAACGNPPARGPLGPSNVSASSTRRSRWAAVRASVIAHASDVPISPNRKPTAVPTAIGRLCRDRPASSGWPSRTAGGRCSAGGDDSPSRDAKPRAESMLRYRKNSRRSSSSSRNAASRNRVSASVAVPSA